MVEWQLPKLHTGVRFPSPAHISFRIGRWILSVQRFDDDSGAKPIILSDRQRVAEFPFPEGKIDIDTMEDLELAQRTQRETL